jgi:hypothetical protein
MKLQDLFEEAKFDAVKERASLIAKIRDVKADIASLQKKSASVVQNGIAPQYKSQWDRLQASKKSIQSDLDKIESREKAEAESLKFHQEIEAKRSSETSTEKKERFGQAVSQGLKHTQSVRKEEGGHEGVAKKMLDYVQKASKDGSEKLTAEDIAHQFDTTARTVNRWLERPEFTKVARLLGRR